MDCSIESSQRVWRASSNSDQPGYAHMKLEEKHESRGASIQQLFRPVALEDQRDGIRDQTARRTALRTRLRAYMARSARSSKTSGRSSGNSGVTPHDAPTCRTAPSWGSVMRATATSMASALARAADSEQLHNRRTNSSPPTRATTSDSRMWRLSTSATALSTAS